MKMRLLLFVSVLIGSISLSLLGSNATFAQSDEGAAYSSPMIQLANADMIELDPAEEDSTENPATSCAIEGIGWIICPVVRTMAMLVDGAYLFVSSLLVVQPLLSTGAGPNVSVYNAWTMMRNIANVAFVIAFLMIIFSQLTSVGLNNYGIKKMLPRLIVAAILVNVSFWICAIAVDVSNIAGSSLNSVMQGLAKTGDCNISPSGSRNCLAIVMDDENPDTTTGVGWDGIAGLIIAGTGIAGVALYPTLAALLPALLAAVVAILTVFLVLTLRQALIILLVVISPLAFVAYLLPNTEQLFKKWKALFQTLLLMYPIIAMLFGASALASTIVMNSAPEGNYKVAVQVMGALISIIPLALTPIVMKTAGGVLNRFAGMVNNPNKGPIDKLRKKAEGYRDYRQDIARGNRLSRGKDVLGKSGGALGEKYSRRRRAAAAITSFGATSKIDAEKQKGFAKAVADETGQEYFAKRALNQEGFAEKIAGDPNKVEGLKASAQSAVDKITQQDAVNREILYTADISIRNNPKQKLEQLLASGENDEVGIKALGSMLMKGGSAGYGNFNDAVTNYESTADPQDAKARANIDAVKKFVSDNGKDFKARDPAMLKWAKDVNGFNTLQAAAAHPKAIDGSDQEVASVIPDALRKAAQHGNIAVEKARAILSNPDLANATSDDNKETLRAVIANNGQPITGVDIKAEIARHANNAPTVEQIQQAARQQAPSANAGAQPTYAPPQASPATPGTFNVPHNPTPASANPGNSRTSPPPNTGSFSGNNRSAGGIYIPNGTQTPPQQPPTNPPQGPPPNNP